MAAWGISVGSTLACLALLAAGFLGVDIPALVTWLARHSWMGLLEAAYLSTVPLVFAAAIILAWTKRSAAMWELCLAFAGSAAACSFLSALLPAVGTFAYYDIPPDVVALLPAWAGRYSFRIFFEYRSGELDTVDIVHFEGVVTFPSFHTAMALMVPYALRSVWWLLGPVVVWSGLTVISTVPIDGLYAVDVLSGTVVLALCILPTRLQSGRATVRLIAICLRIIGRLPPYPALSRCHLPSDGFGRQRRARSPMNGLRESCLHLFVSEDHLGRASGQVGRACIATTGLEVATGTRQGTARAWSAHLVTTSRPRVLARRRQTARRLRQQPYPDRPPGGSAVRCQTCDAPTDLQVIERKRN